MSDTVLGVLSLGNIRVRFDWWKSMLHRLNIQKSGVRCGGQFLVAMLVASVMGAEPVGQSAELGALDGQWVYVEDLTEGRELERLGPPMSNSFTLKVDEAVVILVSGHGSGHRDVRVALDGSVTELETETSTAQYKGSWEDGVFKYQVQHVRADGSMGTLIEREFQKTDDGVVVRAKTNFSNTWSVGLYKHREDIAMPTPLPATIDKVAWISGNWVGTRGASGTTSIEERWGPPLGGSMLGTSRTVSRERLSAFEYLRILERDGGLVYVAQPNGGTATEFVLTEVSETRAVFDNPRHDYPKRIVYELGDGGKLTATIGYMKGGTPGRYEFSRED